jgi:hypothetical protein
MIFHNELHTTATLNDLERATHLQGLNVVCTGYRPSSSNKKKPVENMKELINSLPSDQK